MALSSAMVFEIRQGGSATNGGAFKAGASGTDYSQQNAAQIAYTDLVIDGAVGNKLTSAGNPFTSAHVGNVINITGGTGFTTGRYEILSVSLGIATMDRIVGTIDSVGGTGNLGGALRDIVDADAVYASGHVIYLRNDASYSRTTTQTLTGDGAEAARISLIGYDLNGSRADVEIAESVMPVLTSATNSLNHLTLNNANRWTIKNIKFAHTAATRGAAIVGATAGTSFGPSIINCVSDGCSTLLNTRTGGGVTNLGNVSLIRCTVRNWTSAGITHLAGQDLLIDSCDLQGGAGPALLAGNTTGLSVFTALRSIFRGATGATGHGIYIPTTTGTGSAGDALRIDSCVCEGNAQSGMRLDLTTGNYDKAAITNSIFYNNGAYGISHATAGYWDGLSPYMSHLAFGANTSGAKQNVRTGLSEITLSADPFTAKGAGNDYSLNNATGGGALLRQLGFPGRIGALGANPTSSYPDVGASEHLESLGGISRAREVI